jgi:DNA-binding IclR family transcriptional regulator
VAVLELLANHPDDRFTLSEVARRCRLNKATAHALLSALSERGVLLRHPDEKRYSLGPRLVAIGEAARRGYSAADFAPAVLASLAGETGLWARSWRVVGDRMEAAAQAGGPDGGTAPPVRLPLVPPVGATFMAWSDGPTVEAWLARAGAVDVVRPALEAIAAIRQQGFSVARSSPEWRALTEPVALPVAAGDGAGRPMDPPDPSLRRSLLAAVGRQTVLVPVLDDGESYEPAHVESAVFGSDGRVELVLSLTCPAGAAMAGAEVRRLAEVVVAAADRLTAAVSGRRP